MQSNYIKQREKGKHLSLVERGMIQALKKQKKSNVEIAREIGVCSKTIQRELKRGKLSY